MAYAEHAILRGMAIEPAKAPAGHILRCVCGAETAIEPGFFPQAE